MLAEIESIFQSLRPRGAVRGCKLRREFELWPAFRTRLTGKDVERVRMAECRRVRQDRGDAARRVRVTPREVATQVFRRLTQSIESSGHGFLLIEGPMVRSTGSRKTCDVSVV